MLHRNIKFIRKFSSSVQFPSKMVVRHHVEGYDKFVDFMDKFQSRDPVFVLFSGSKLPDGTSWCPDCVEAIPHIEEGIKAAPGNSHFIYVEVGDRSFWKNNKCPFRTDSKTQLKVLPTLSKWGTQKRLEGNDCSKKDLVEMLVADEEE